MKKLSELEAVVLGLVWAEGPCTSYAVRRVVQTSLSARWSGSAGAVYPAVARLEERGLVRRREQATGHRRSTALEITPSGTRALKSWMGPPLDPASLGIPPDPLRTRLRFLEVLPPARRRAFLDEAIESLEAGLAEVRADVALRRKKGESPYEVAMACGVLYASQARLRTLRELRETLP